MKKATIKKFPSVKKNSTFRALWAYYHRAQRDFLEANKRKKETKKAYKTIRSDKSASKSLVKAWKAENKRAKKNKALKQAIVKDARRHVKNWLKAFQAWQKLEDCRSKLAKSKSGSKQKAAAKKVAKPAKAKEKPKAKKVKKASPKPKAAPAQPKLVIAKKITVVKAPKLKPSANAKPKARPAAKRAVKKTSAPPKPKPTTARKAAPRKKSTTVKPRAAVVRRDNLKRVEGIGVKIEQMLRSAGIDSFEKLSKATKTTLRGLLDKAGPHFKASDPTTWPRQAKMAAQGQWEELKKWQSELKGGKIVK